MKNSVLVPTLCTHEQIALFLYRYAKYKGRGVNEQAELISFIDADKIKTGEGVIALEWAKS